MRWILPLLAFVLTGPFLKAGSDIPLAKLPRPEGTTVLVETPQTIILVTGSGVSEAIEKSQKTYTAAGWEPYGTAGTIHYFKKGNTRAQLHITASPAQPGKTHISLGVETLSADLPLPSDTTEVQYSDSTKTLGFTSTEAPAEIAEFYRKTLAPRGWSSKMEKPVLDEFKEVFILRHPTEGMVRIEMTPGGESLRAAVKYFNADDVAAEDAKAAAQKAKLMDKLAAAANAPKLPIALPSDIKSKALRKNTLQFNLPIGRAQPAVEAIEKDLIGSGWKRTGGNLQKETGNLQLTKDALSLSVVYMDPGFMPAEVTLTSTGVELDVK